MQDNNKSIRPIVSGRKLNSQFFLNRERSWLAFNERVLSLTVDKNIPLLERLRFYDIFISNHDEFYMKRVGRLIRTKDLGLSKLSIDGRTASEQLDDIHQLTRELNQKASQLFERELVAALRKEKIFFRNFSGLKVEQQKKLNELFREKIFPVLTPISVNPAMPFPYLSNLSTSLGISLSHPDSESKRFARVKIPQALEQWINVSLVSNEFEFINVIDIIVANLGSLFHGMQIEDIIVFRVTRNADWDEDDQEESIDVMEIVEEGLRERKFAPVIRLEYRTIKQGEWVIQYLRNEFHLTKEFCFELDRIYHFSPLGKIIKKIERAEFQYSPIRQRIPSIVAESLNTGRSIFDGLKKQDLLVHYPFDSYQMTLEQFIKEASEDPNVLTIKVTFYRTDPEGILVNSLIKAAERGKQVACIFELKARFDERQNIIWAQKLEEHGIHVAYGVLGLKTHAKMAIVVRREKKTVRTYFMIGTGNFNSITAKVYTDLGIFSANKKLAKEVHEVFNFLTGSSIKKDYSLLLVAPFTMKAAFIKLIKNEMTYGPLGQIIAKMNSLEDVEIISLLYQASQKGVKITLYVRGFCCIRPGVKGMSENIEVRSIIGRLLEHSRIFYFKNGAETPQNGTIYLGSADWMHRNLHNRVEVMVPVVDEENRKTIYNYLLNLKKDNLNSWVLGPMGSYRKIQARGKKENYSIHDDLLAKAAQGETR